MLAVQQRPDLYYAYVGSGQMVSQRVTDQRIWRDLLTYADRVGDGALYDQILTLGEPPYRDSPWANSLVMGYYGLVEPAYDPPPAYVARGQASGIGMFGLFGSEYDFVDNVNLIRGLVDMFSLMYPQLQQARFPHRRGVSRGARLSARWRRRARRSARPGPRVVCRPAGADQERSSPSRTPATPSSSSRPTLCT